VAVERQVAEDQASTAFRCGSMSATSGAARCPQPPSGSASTS